MRGAAEEAGVERETLRQWIIQYEKEGVAAFLSNRRNRIYKPELKRRAVQEYLSGGGSLLEVSKKYGLRDKKTLREWIKVYAGFPAHSCMERETGEEKERTPPSVYRRGLGKFEAMR